MDSASQPPVRHRHHEELTVAPMQAQNDPVMMNLGMALIAVHGLSAVPVVHVAALVDNAAILVRAARNLAVS